MSLAFSLWCFNKWGIDLRFCCIVVWLAKLDSVALELVLYSLLSFVISLGSTWLLGGYLSDTASIRSIVGWLIGSLPAKTRHARTR